MLRFGRDQEPRFVHPKSIMHTENGHFIIPDAGKNRILIYDPHGQPTHDFAYVYGSKALNGVAMTHEGYIVMPFEDRFHKGVGFYTPRGAYLTTAYVPDNASIGGVAVNSKNHVMVTDPNNSKIYIIREGRQKISNAYDVPRLMGEDHAPQPFAIVFDKEDNILITDIANHCIKVLDQEGRFLFSFGSLGERPEQFHNPMGITLDSNDRIIVADRDNHRVTLFDPEGTFIEYVVRYDRGENVYLAPIDVASINDREVAVLLNGTRDADAGEARVYSCV